MNRNLIMSLDFLAVAVPATAHAGDKPRYAPAPDWVKPAPMPASGTDAPALLILDQQQRLEDGEVWSYFETATRIASPEMLAQAGTVKLGWQPDDGDLIVHRVAILRDGATISLLKGEGSFTVLRREAQLEAMTMDGVLTATLAAEGLRVGDVLAIAYSVTRRDRALNGQVQTLVPLVGAPLRVGFARARLLWKPTLDLHFRSLSPAAPPVVKTVGAYREVEVTVPLAKADDLPEDAPIRVRPLPILEAGSFADWAAVSRAMAPLYRTEGLIAAGSPLAGEVAKIAAASTDPRTRAGAALALVQEQIRYLAQGMEVGNYLPQKPAQTWSVRYGDCKAKTLLLLAILHALKIEAEPILAHTALGDAVPRRLPLPAAFNHVLVRASIGGESLWLDGTRNGDLLVDIGDAPPLVWVLPVRDAGAVLLSVPRRAPARPEVAMTLDIDHSAGLGLPALYTASMTMRGGMAGALASAVAQVTPEQRDEMIGRVVGRMVDVGQMTSRQLTQDKAAGTVTLTVRGLTQSGWRIEDKRQTRLLDRTVSEIAFEPDRSRPAWRDIPVATGAPSTIRISQRLTLPMGGRGFTIDGDRTLPVALAGATLTRSVAVDGSVLRIDDTLAQTGAEVAPADVSTMRSAIALAKTRLLRVRAPADYPARWQVVTAARQSGALKSIEAAYAAGIATEPKKAMPYENRANYRVGVYDWRGAAADMDKAIAIEPSVDRYLARARMYERVGDMAKALADADRAYALDGGSLQTVNLLTWLKAVTDKRDEALAMIEDRIAAGGENRTFYLSRKAEFLVQAGRGADAVAAADAALAAKPGDASAYNERCWTKATANLQLDTALKDCSRAIELGESPAAAFDSRAMVYYRMGRFDEALEDLAAALDLAPNNGGSLFLRGVVRTRKGETAAAAVDLAAARLIDPRVDGMYARWGVKP